MLDHLPSLQALRAFGAVADLGGVRPAARELHVSEAALSQHLRRLEERLGQRLFRKAGRGLMLTEVGRRYHQMLSAPLAELSRATEVVSGSRRSRQVTITMAPTLATLWFIPKLSRIERDLPGVDVRIVATTALLDLGRYDIAIAVRQLPDHAIPPDLPILIREHAFPVCTPTLLARMPDRDALLTKARLLHNRTHPNEWAAWLASYGGGHKASPDHHWLEESAMVLAAAVQSYGVALGRKPLVDGYLRDGRLIAPFGEDFPTGYSYVLIRGDSVTSPQATDRVLSWLKANTGDHPPPPPA